MGNRMRSRYFPKMNFAAETNTFRLFRQMRDYAQVGLDLFWQRQVIFAAALALAAFYYSVTLALSVLGLIALSESYDYLVFRQILNSKGRNPAEARKFLYKLYVGTTLSASIIVAYSVGISQIQGPAMHFMPLFFLFAAALFAAMNNHYLKPVLALRQLIYGAAFLYIPIRDIVITGADIHSELWAQLFSSLFVLYFIIDSSHIYFKLYQTKLKQIDLLKEEAKKSRAAYEAKTEFLATMSHELRTPLTAIRGSVDLANSGRMGALPPKVSDVLTIAQRNCVRLITLINDILDLQKVEAGRMVFETETFDLVSATDEAINTNRPFAHTLGVEIERAAIPGAPVLITADKFRLEQVFTNILSNAAKFSPNGGEVLVRIEANDGQARVSFSDQGIGLSEDEYERVFDRFSQVDSSDTRKIGGTGLGMNISKRIVEAFDGTIGYHRNDDVGTTFYVELPLAAA